MAMVKEKQDTHYTEAYFYAQGRKDSRNAPDTVKGVKPELFAFSYVQAFRSWEKSDQGPKKWPGVATFFNRYINASNTAAQ